MKNLWDVSVKFLISYSTEGRRKTVGERSPIRRDRCLDTGRR